MDDLTLYLFAGIGALVAARGFLIALSWMLDLVARLFGRR